MRLTYSNMTTVAARDPSRKRVLLGGLGAFGVGQMWVDEEEKHAGYKGYVDSPIRNEESPEDLHMSNVEAESLQAKKD